MHAPSRAHLRGDAEALAKAAGFILLSELVAAFLPLVSPAVATAVCGGVLLLVLWIALARRTNEEFFVILRQRTRISWGMVATGSALTALYCAGTAVAQVLYVTLVGAPETSDIERALYQPYGWIPFSVIVVLLAPFAEEAALRGYLQGRLEPRYGGRIAVSAAAILFAVLHLSVSGFPLFIAMGLVLGYVAFRTRSIWISTAMHASSNLALVALSLRYGPESTAADLPAQTGISVAQFGLALAIIAVAFTWVVSRPALRAVRE